jgi:endonuclease/exonuclease/phosphatase (EEP) superfamily protein YafD
MTPALYLATALLLIVTLLPLWRNTHWVIRALDFPRLQFASFALLLLITQLVFFDLQKSHNWALIITVATCLAWHLWWILPYTHAWPLEAPTATDEDEDRELSIITANVLTTNRNAGPLLELVAINEPDVLLTLESDQWWQDQLDKLEADMPYTVKCPLDNLYGMHVYSRLPLREAEISFMVQEDVPSIHALLSLRSGHTVRMHFLHPAPPGPAENTQSAERDAELVMVARSIARTDQPVIVTGDLNDVAWSSTTRLFRRLSGLLDPRVGRGMFNTFHANYRLLRWPLDYLFHSQHFSVRSLKRLPPIGSDHFPLLTRLTYTTTHEIGHTGLTPDSGDQERAQSIVDREDVTDSDVPRPGE